MDHLLIDIMFAPVVDYDFLPDIPVKMLERKEFHSVPCLTGTNQHDGNLMLYSVYPDLVFSDYYPIINITYLREILPEYLYFSSPLLVAAAEQWYVDWTQADNATANQLDQFIDLMTDQVSIHCSSEQWLSFPMWPCLKPTKSHFMLRFNISDPIRRVIILLPFSDRTIHRLYFPELRKHKTHRKKCLNLFYRPTFVWSDFSCIQNKIFL